ncbi:LacI family DNA-binding transcriptional regulator [Cellulosimicrobium arenosum]|uniref:LacI family DNA-binding transcriptional regulator n=2 Tax=Cellulosimicrobium arenosum TaxID=2708133 RepID=A0A927G8V2_9MICO|nr:LacI family DNA-binding transcriptional regulator [Cellulosimicrobium arenosum]
MAQERPDGAAPSPVAAADGAPRRGGRRPTLAAVAELAGVSLKTASRVLNDEPNVATATRERVRASAQQLGFRRNAVAADLARGGSSRLVGFVTGDLANPFYSALASGIERELRRHELQLITTSSDEEPDRERSVTEALVERRVGALVVTPTSTDHASLQTEIDSDLPVVFVDRPAQGVEADTVVLDNRGGVRDAVTHLLAHGHRRIALVGDVSRLWTFQERRDEFVATLRDAGIEDPSRYVRDGAHDDTLAHAFVTDLLALPEPPTAVLTANNKITVGALHALRDRASARPDASPVALVGFDDFALADLLDVTVVGYDAVEMGRQAASLAVSRREDPDLAPRMVVVPTRLVVRGTGEIAGPGSA